MEKNINLGLHIQDDKDYYIQNKAYKTNINCIYIEGINFNILFLYFKYYFSWRFFILNKNLYLIIFFLIIIIISIINLDLNKLDILNF